MFSLSYGVLATQVTLRAHIYIVNNRQVTILAALATILFGMACGAKVVSSPRGDLPQGVRLEELSVAGKGPDTWRWLKRDSSGEKEALVREEFDLNLDHRVDLTRIYENGLPSQTTMDLDFDGKIDRTDFYVNGALVRVEVGHLFDGKTDTWRFYDKGNLLRVERDTNRDGKPDEWMYFEEGRLKRTGRDYNFDGVVDTWEE